MVEDGQEELVFLKQLNLNNESKTKMATTLAEGIFPCTVLSAGFGDNEKGIPTAQINVRLDAGPNSGSTTTYEDRVDVKSSLYVGRSLKAVGWKPRGSKWELTTVAEDCAAWIKQTGGESTAEIKHIPYKDKKTGESKIWAKCNSIGRGSQPLTAPKASSLSDANEAMASAMAEDDSMPF